MTDGSDPKMRRQYASVRTTTGYVPLPSSSLTSIRPSCGRAEHLEEVRAHQTAGRSMGLTPPQHVERPVAEFHELIDGLRLRSVIGHFEEREARVLDARGGLRLAQVHDAIGLGIGQRAQQHSIDHAEDGGVGADAQTQGQDEGE
jgi:hypothetical protein